VNAVAWVALGLFLLGFVMAAIVLMVVRRQQVGSAALRRHRIRGAAERERRIPPR
jgi:multisubunit Na+/H+ antiporter MnhE subunit